MKLQRLFIPLLILSLLISGCGNNTADAADENTINQIYTAAAMTFEAQEVDIIPTETPMPTSTPTITSTTTQIATSAKAIAQNNPASNNTSCDASAYVSDVTIPDGTELAPGESFTKTWLIQNTGTCTWSTSYSIKFVSGSAMSGSTTALDETVSPGGQVSISVEMVAPSSTGDYTGYWIMQNAAGTTFGQSMYVQIVVTNDAATATPTPTATDEVEVTSTPTTEKTSTATATPVPSSTTAPTNTADLSTSDDAETSS
jgi:hypothetical protein